MLSDTAFEEIYCRQVKTIYRVCAVLVNNPSDTADMVQTVFLKLLYRSKAFSDPQHEKGWLITVAANTCKDFLKKKDRQAVSLDSASDICTQDYSCFSEVKSAVMKLEPIYRIVIYLFYYEGYNCNEIATIIKKKPATVRSNLLRARNTLRMELEDYESVHLDKKGEAEYYEA